MNYPPGSPECIRLGGEDPEGKSAALVVNTLENPMVDNMADNMVVRPAGRLVGPLKAHCPNCGGEFGWRPDLEIPDQWNFEPGYVGDCPIP